MQGCRDFQTGLKLLYLIQAYKQFGNSVVVPLMENVAELVVSKMEELEKKIGHDGEKNDVRKLHQAGSTRIFSPGSLLTL